MGINSQVKNVCVSITLSAIVATNNKHSTVAIGGSMVPTGRRGCSCATFLCNFNIFNFRRALIYDSWTFFETKIPKWTILRSLPWLLALWPPKTNNDFPIVVAVWPKQGNGSIFFLFQAPVAGNVKKILSYLDQKKTGQRNIPFRRYPQGLISCHHQPHLLCDSPSRKGELLKSLLRPNSSFLWRIDFQIFHILPRSRTPIEFSATFPSPPPKVNIFLPIITEECALVGPGDFPVVSGLVHNIESARLFSYCFFKVLVSKT